MAVGQNFLGGISVAFGVAFIVAIGDGLSSWILNGETLSSKIKGTLGGKN